MRREDGGVALAQDDDGIGGTAEPHGRLDHRVEHRLNVRRRTGDGLQDSAVAVCRSSATSAASRAARIPLCPPLLGDVAVDQHEPPPGTALRRTSITVPSARVRSIAQLAVGVLEATGELGLRRSPCQIRRARPAFGDSHHSGPFHQKRIGQADDLLEVAVPGPAWFAVEHGHAIAHVVEGTRSSASAVAQLLEQAGVLDGDHRLVGETVGERDLLVGERLDAGAAAQICRPACLRVSGECRAECGTLLSSALPL